MSISFRRAIAVIALSAPAWAIAACSSSDDVTATTDSGRSETVDAPPEAPTPDGECWKLPTVTRARLLPREGHAAAMVGGRIVGSNESATGGFVELASITTAPNEGAWSELPIATSTTYRYVKYFGAAGSHGDVAELELYAGASRLDGEPFGTVSSSASAGAARAFDGDPKTYFDGAQPDNQYVGLDLGAGHEVEAPVIAPGSGRFTTATTVTITEATPGAIVRYTVDGSDPHSGLEYRGPIAISATTLVRAIATRACMLESSIGQALYSIGAPSKGVQSMMNIGNSLTGNVADVVPMIASSGKNTLASTTCLTAGASTKELWEGKCEFGVPDLKSTLASQPFDNLTAQPFAAMPCTPGSKGGDAEYASDFWRLARKANPDVQLWVYAQWAQPTTSDWSSVDCFSNGSPWASPPWAPPHPATDWESAVDNHVAFHEAVRDELEKTNPGGKRPLIIPGGLALKNLKHAIEAGQVPGTSQFFSTAFGLGGTDLHLAPAGRYMVGLVFYACMFRESPEGLGVADSGLSKEQALVYQRIAWKTALDYPLAGVR